VDKRYQVFVSSTFEDLKAEREEVVQALLKLKCMPAGMEMFPAANDEQWTLIQRVIEACDYYIVILGGRYGSVHSSGKGYTQMEYEYAISKGKPVLGFLHGSPGSIPMSKNEDTEEGRQKLAAFRELVQRRMCKFWTTPQDLAGSVVFALLDLFETYPAVGWVRGDSLASDEATREILRLRERIEELEGQLRKPPLPVEDLAQGDETFMIHYSYLLLRDIHEAFNQRDQFCTLSINLSWNSIFSVVGARLFSPVAEKVMKGALEDFVKQSVRPDLETKHGRSVIPFHNLQNFSIDDDDFETMKVQLSALGLIELTRRPGGDGGSLWVLTRRGEELLIHLRAIRRPPARPASE